MNKKSLFLLLGTLILTGCSYPNESSSLASSSVDNASEKLKSFPRIIDSENYKGEIDETGNVWAVFLPSYDGHISLTTTSNNGYDVFLAVYDLSSLDNDLSKLKTAYSNSIGYVRGIMESTPRMDVYKEHTYVIKYGIFECRDNSPFEPTEYTEYVGKTLGYSFIYTY